VDPARFGESRRGFGAQFVVADADGTFEPGAFPYRLPHPARQRFGIVGVGTEKSLVPSGDLDHDRKFPQYRHDAFGHLFVSGDIGGQEHRIRAFAERGSQRHSGMHAEFARLVRGGGDDPTLLRIALSADHHGFAP